MMDQQDFPDDEDQEQQSQQAESASNLNDASLNQDDDTNIHNQLTETSKDKKQIKRICIIHINKEWKSERQIFIAFLILSIVILFVICGIILGNMNIATYLIEQSAIKETEDIIQNTLENSVQACTNLYKEVFFRYSVSLNIISRLLLSSLKEDESLYDPDYSKFPLKGQMKYYSIKQDIKESELTERDKSMKEYYQGQTISLDNISYFSTKNPDDFTDISAVGKDYLEAADNLNYFLKNIINFDKSLTRIQQLFITFNNDLEIFYPAGSCKKLLNYQGQQPALDITQRPWYKKTFDNYNQLKKIKYVITGPYNDITTGLPCITISQVIVSKTNKVIGVIGLDVLTSDINTIIPKSQLYKNGKFYFANIDNGILLNDPCNIRIDDPFNPKIPYYAVNQTSITGFTQQNWNEIKDQTEKNGTFFEVVNANSQKIIIHRQFIKESEQYPELILFATIPHEEGYEEYDDIQKTLNKEFRMTQYFVMITAGSITVFSLICSFYVVKSIVSPLQELADCTKEFTHQEKKNSTSELKKKKTFDDIKTSDSDIASLILAFKKLIKDLTGFKKGTRKDNQGEDSIEYPQGDQQRTGFHKQTRFLSDYDEFIIKIKYYVEILQQFSIIVKQYKQNDSIDENYYDNSQNDISNQEYAYQKIEVSFLNFVEIILNWLEQVINEATRKGQIPQLGLNEIQIYTLIQNFFFYLIQCERYILIYDKFRSFQPLEQDDDEQDQDHIQEEEFSNLPEEALYIFDRKTSLQRIDELISKFKKIDQITFQHIKQTIQIKSTQFIKDILPKEIIE